ncbi:hypothetical protein FG379_001545 [Cryptosporidium bovis]|uniref:uncharacterized protein n=1 Tax=Cryptosporidium bovis TaxID=310047 RepID=UPI00351AA4A3|nr:hypothetical protein FG379_001545 [Cryptosporidium bovis]
MTRLVKKSEKLNNVTGINRFVRIKMIFVLSIIMAIASKTECIRYKDKLRLQEGGLGSFLLGIAGNALSTGLQVATGSPLVPNPAAGMPGVSNALSGLATPSGSVQGAPGAGMAGAGAGAGIAGAGAGAGMAGAGAGTGVAGAGAGTGVAGAGAGTGMAGAGAGAGTGMVGAGAGTGAGIAGAVAGPGMAGATGAIPGAAPSALSFTTISFGLVVMMMICMVMLMCRRCTKDDNDD